MSDTSRSTNYREAGYARQFDLSRGLTAATSSMWAELIGNSGHGTVRIVLDLGAGTGRFWPCLRKAFPTSKIIGIDINEPMLVHSDISTHDVYRIVGDVSNIPIRLGQADFALCSMVLHHISDPVSTLASLRLSLRQGGRVFIRQGTKETIGSFFFLQFFPTALDIEQKKMPATDDVKRAIKESGLSLIQSTQVRTPSANTSIEYLEKVRGRGFPSLQLISDDEFEEGIEMLTRCLEQQNRSDHSFALESTSIFVCEVQ